MDVESYLSRFCRSVNAIGGWAPSKLWSWETFMATVYTGVTSGTSIAFLSTVLLRKRATPRLALTMGSISERRHLYFLRLKCSAGFSVSFRCPHTWACVRSVVSQLHLIRDNHLIFHWKIFSILRGKDCYYNGLFSELTLQLLLLLLLLVPRSCAKSLKSVRSLELGSSQEHRSFLVLQSLFSCIWEGEVMRNDHLFASHHSWGCLLSQPWATIELF